MFFFSNISTPSSFLYPLVILVPTMKENFTANQENFLRYLFSYGVPWKKLKYLGFLLSNYVPEKVSKNGGSFSNLYLRTF